MRKQLIFLLLMFVIGCDLSETGNDSRSKTEYSILQSYEYKCRDLSNDRPYLIYEQALNSELTVLAFPIANKSKGYVVMIADAKADPKLKSMPDADFIVGLNTLVEVKKKIAISREVDDFITTHIK